MKKETFTVNGMKCNMCRQKVEQALNAIDGVENAVANLEDKNVEISYNEAEVTPEAFVEAVDAIGFELEK